MPAGLPNPFATPVARIITHDRACHRCAYNLKGLKTGDRCPECGTPIRVQRVGGGSMTEAPMAYLDRLAWWSTAGVVLLGATLGFMVAAGFMPSGSPITVFLAGGAALTSGLWALAVYRTTEPRRLGEASTINTDEEWRGLRTWTRVLACAAPAGLAIAFVCATVAYGRAASAAAGAVVTPSPFLAWCMVGAGVLLLAGFVGLFLTGAYWSLLADWANDMALAMSLRAAPFVMLITVPVAALFVFMIGLARATARMIIVAPAIVIAGAGLLACLWFAGMPFIRFAVLGHWARANQVATLTRDRRASAAIVRRVEDGQAKDESLPAVPVHAPSRPQGAFLPRSGEGSYDLAPPEPPAPVA